MDNINGFGPFYEGSNPSEPILKKMVDKKFFAGLAILIGTVIGAGILGIPYVLAKVIKLSTIVAFWAGSPIEFTFVKKS